jgi:predicted nucleic acid-binding protein
MSHGPTAVDTSVAVPLLLRTHPAHSSVARWAEGKTLCLSGHAGVETYSVLTRLPPALRVSGAEVATVMDEAFAEVLTLPPAVAAEAHRELARLGIEGGAVYDALVAMAARERGLLLATRDARAQGTYLTVGASVRVLAPVP